MPVSQEPAVGRSAKSDREHEYRKANREKARAYKNRPEVRERDNFQKRIWKMGRLRFYDRKKRADPWTWARRITAVLKLKAKQKGIRFEITPHDVMDVIPKDHICPALGIALVFGEKLSRQSPSVDRLIPSLGYVPGNIFVISHKANSIKQDAIDPTELRLVADFFDRSLRARANQPQAQP